MGERTMLHPFSPVQPAANMAHSEPGVCLRKTWIEFDCSLKKRASRFVALRRLHYQHPPSHKQIIGIEIRGSTSYYRTGRWQHAGKCIYDPSNNLVLQQENVREITVEAVSPKVCAILRIDQLNVDADTGRRPAHAAFDYIPHPQIFGDQPNVDRLSLEGKRRVP